MLQFFLFRIRVIRISFIVIRLLPLNQDLELYGFVNWYVLLVHVERESASRMHRVILSHSSLTHDSAMILSPLPHRNLCWSQRVSDICYHQSHEVQTSRKDQKMGSPLRQFIDLHLDCILLRMVFFWVKTNHSLRKFNMGKSHVTRL